MDEAGVMDVDQSVDSGIDSSVSTENTHDNHVDESRDDPYSSKASREYSQWLKDLKEKNPDSAKWARLGKDNHSRLYQLQQMEPKGIDGVREKYALIDSVMHGELKGVEAIGALQDELRGVQEIDERLFSGDATALSEMGDEFVQQALPKLAGPILEMVRDSNPEAYAAAVLPHFVEALKSSELVSSFNGLVDVLMEQPPKWLTPDQKSQWTEDRLQRVTGLASKMGNWFNAQQAKAGELPKAANGNGVVKPGKETTELETLRKEQEAQHWTTNITPKLDAHADKVFDDLYRPYAKRLGLGKEQIADVKQAWVSSITKKAMANPAYSSQITRYHSQRKADPATVVNLAKVEFDKHSRSMMDSLMKTRFGNFLNGKPKAATPPAGKPGVKPAVGVQTVTVKPSNIDYKRTTPDMIHAKRYWTTDGKQVQWQR